MCYNVVSATRKNLQYARHRSEKPEVIEQIIKHLDELHKTKRLEPFYRVQGFSHPRLMVFSNEKPEVPGVFRWGLIPSWTPDEQKAKEIAQMTLNAKSETMFSKPAFRNSARSKRCLIYLDAFFEHHHFSGKTYPVQVSMQNEQVMIVGGLWDEWVDRSTGEIIRSVSVVTCKANRLMRCIHNNPRNPEARMPVLLNRETQEDWLNGDEQRIGELCAPFPEEALRWRTVRPILGKHASPNTGQANESYAYPELVPFPFEGN